MTVSSGMGGPATGSSWWSWVALPGEEHSLLWRSEEEHRLDGSRAGAKLRTEFAWVRSQCRRWRRRGDNRRQARERRRKEATAIRMSHGSEVEKVSGWHRERKRTARRWQVTQVATVRVSSMFHCSIKTRPQASGWSALLRGRQRLLRPRDWHGVSVPVWEREQPV